jgi:hypothetical protein
MVLVLDTLLKSSRECEEEGRGWGSGWRYKEITHDPLLFTSVEQGIF